MNNILLYVLCVLIWGSTWFVITFQLGVVSPAVSVFYRFLLAAILSFSYCLIRKRSLRFSKKEHIWLAAQGLCMFCGNYIFTYTSETYISSGIVAVAFTLLIYFNMLGMRIFYKRKLEGRVVLSALIGAMGICFIFYDEIAGVGNNPHGIKGLLLAITATTIASIGNVISVGIRRKNLPVIQSNAWSMLYGSLMTFIIALSLGLNFDFVFTPSYVFSLLYLAVFGSVVAFGAYITLIGSIGPDRAAYTGILTPVIALILSSIFENFHWNLHTFVGVALSVLGNYLILSPKKPKLN